MTPAVYVFGGSLADVGNNNYLISALKANYPHNGIDFPRRKPTGRFSNGGVFPDFLAEKLGLKSPPPYLSIKTNISLTPTAKTNIFLKGISFASGGAGILNTTNQNKCISMSRQMDYFSEVKTALLGKLGNVETHKYLSKSIFIIVIGSNDLFAYLSSSSSSSPSIQTFVDSLVTKLKDQLKSMYDLGARKIAFIGSIPIGCTPYQRLKNSTRDCDVEPNIAALRFNEGVLSVFREMKSNLGDFGYSFFDSYMAMMEILRSPSIYGFKEIKDACCGLGDLKAQIPCLPISTYCLNREEHIFWDFAHPTEASARKLSEQIFDGPPSVASPINLRQLASL